MDFEFHQRSGISVGLLASASTLAMGELSIRCRNQSVASVGLK